MGKKVYTEAIAQEICERIALGESLNSICKSKHLPAESTVRLWVINEISPEFTARYALARQMQFDRWADEILDIADNSTNDWMIRQVKDGEDCVVVNSEHINRSRLRVDSRKWLLCKMVPKVFGDRLQQEITGAGGLPLQVLIDITPAKIVGSSDE